MAPDLPGSLFPQERKSIESLQRLAENWPRSLKLVSAAGTLVVVRTKQNVDKPFVDQVLTTIYGIPNDGGDPW